MLESSSRPGVDPAPAGWKPALRAAPPPLPAGSRRYKSPPPSARCGFESALSEVCGETGGGCQCLIDLAAFTQIDTKSPEGFNLRG
ncbi:MAG TPA: hypothetical protein VF099_06585, partial [Ktedonobacterales bacterium]